MDILAKRLMKIAESLYDAYDTTNIYIGRTDEYYAEDDDDGVFSHEDSWWTWSENRNDSDFAKEGPKYLLTDEGKADFFAWLDAEQVGYSLGSGRMKDWPTRHYSPEEEWKYLTNSNNGLAKKNIKQNQLKLHLIDVSKKPSSRWRLFLFLWKIVIYLQVSCYNKVLSARSSGVE